jgi:hypothetical protein
MNQEVKEKPITPLQNVEDYERTIANYEKDVKEANDSTEK